MEHLIKTVSPLKHWELLKFWKHHWETTYANILVEEQLIGDHNKVLPEYKNWFKALELTKPKDVKVVILGQDPYPTKGHAHGLAFSVMPHVSPLPGSLRNLLVEYSDDLGFPRPHCGDLSLWAQRGVLLLNTILTVEEGKPLSHSGLGWEKLTYEIVRVLRDEPVVFILMGKKAQEYGGAVPASQRIDTVHPSPVNNGGKDFFGSKPFSRANEALKAMGREPVDWRLV